MFLANENFPGPGTLLSRGKRFFVKSIQEDFPGIDDLEVMKIANREQFIILTFDRDYGELIFKYAKDNPPAVAFFVKRVKRPILQTTHYYHYLKAKQ
ncbi:MAG: DUF5615 family PIN-like protein [Bacteroidota bacterium]|nr:DUF5615 family PIN-like protein [Bacteroidota bacterium]